MMTIQNDKKYMLNNMVLSSFSKDVHNFYIKMKSEFINGYTFPDLQNSNKDEKNLSQEVKYILSSYYDDVIQSQLQRQDVFYLVSFDIGKKDEISCFVVLSKEEKFERDRVYNFYKNDNVCQLVYKSSVTYSGTEIMEKFINANKFSQHIIRLGELETVDLS